MDNRDCMLISWSARDIEGYIFPVIQDLTNKFKIIVFVLNISKPDELVEKLDLMLKEKIIADYFITPKKIHGFLLHLYMKKTTNLLRKYNIKLWLCSDEMQICEKYISDNLVQPDTKTICLCNQLTYLFTRNPALAKQLLSDLEYDAELVIDQSQPDGFIRKKFRDMINTEKNIKDLIKYIFSKKVIILRYIAIKTHKSIFIVLNRYIYPFLMVRKFYVPTHLESVTQLSDGNASAYIFFDTYEVEAHKKLFRNNNIYLGSISKIGNEIHSENKILGILSGWYSHELLDKNILDMYVNDFIKVCKLYKTNSIDLRPHPSMYKNNNYAYQIAETLKNKGIICQVTSCQSSVIEESEKYFCIAGFASAALRDVRLFNHSIDVIAFELVSKKYFSDPKFAFGSSDGIDWINCNGDLIRSNRFNTDNRLSVSEAITRVYDS